ncbi:hypothetical protein VP06_23485 [Methylobacterium aquaticum]|uniref:Uncharacterized protein n=1 Tax=Methylobacterium aquaticum TaxID=270351 RepID=A0A0J6S849_9HYPH|nr:hypothetical protein VP06_23485 [Methylobacterium aquaticum]
MQLGVASTGRDAVQEGSVRQGSVRQGSVRQGSVRQGSAGHIARDGPVESGSHEILLDQLESEAAQPIKPLGDGHGLEEEADLIVRACVGAQVDGVMRAQLVPYGNQHGPWAGHAPREGLQPAVALPLGGVRPILA